jgi:acyl carrier protein
MPMNQFSRSAADDHGILGRDREATESRSMLTAREVYQRLTTVLQEVFDDEELQATPDLTASEIEGWDSLKHVRLVLSVEKAFTSPLPPQRSEI